MPRPLVEPSLTTPLPTWSSLPAATSLLILLAIELKTTNAQIPMTIPRTVRVVRSFRRPRLRRRLMWFLSVPPHAELDRWGRRVGETGPGDELRGPFASGGGVGRCDRLLPALGAEDRGGLEPLEGQVQAQEQLPDELRGGRDALQRGALRDDPEQHGDRGSYEERTSDEAEQRHAPPPRAGPVQQVAEDRPCPDAVGEAGAEKERPVMDGAKRPADRHEGT